MIHWRIHLDEVLIAELTRLPWPGNVRQLEHAIERAVLHRLMAQGGPSRTPLRVLRGDLDPALTCPEPRTAAPHPPLVESLERARHEAFASAFQASSGNAAKAARLLGLSRSFTYKEATRLGILPPPGKR